MNRAESRSRAIQASGSAREVRAVVILKRLVEMNRENQFKDEIEPDYQNDHGRGSPAQSLELEQLLKEAEKLTK